MLPSACMHWFTISHSGRSRGTMIPWFTWLSLALCPSMVRFSDIACPLFDWDFGFYSLERRTSFLLSFPSFCLTLPLLSPGRIESLYLQCNPPCKPEMLPQHYLLLRPLLFELHNLLCTSRGLQLDNLPL